MNDDDDPFNELDKELNNFRERERAPDLASQQVNTQNHDWMQQ